MSLANATTRWYTRGSVWGEPITSAMLLTQMWLAKCSAENDPSDQSNPLGRWEVGSTSSSRRPRPLGRRQRSVQTRPLELEALRHRLDHQVCALHGGCELGSEPDAFDGLLGGSLGGFCYLRWVYRGDTVKSVPGLLQRRIADVVGRDLEAAMGDLKEICAPRTPAPSTVMWLNEEAISAPLGWWPCPTS